MRAPPALKYDANLLHYRHIVPAEWGPFVDCRATLNALAARYPWVSVATPAEFDAGLGLDDPRVCVVDWSNRCQPLTGPAAPGVRRATVLLYALEASGPPSAMLPAQLAHWEAFQTASVTYDGVLTYTPELASGLSTWLGRKCWLYPLGFDPFVKGLPRFEVPKFNEYLWWGSRVGKRQRTLPFMQAVECLTGRVIDVSGAYGRALTGALDTARAALHLAHTDMFTFPQWRAWQVIGTSAALVAELPLTAEGQTEPDTWPLVPGRHFIGFEPLKEDNLDTTASKLAALLDAPLRDIAQCAYEEIGRTYTAASCHERYLVPACQALRRETV